MNFFVLLRLIIVVKEDVLSMIFLPSSKDIYKTISVIYLANSIDPHIKFTMEQGHDDELCFLDTLVTRNIVNGPYLSTLTGNLHTRTDT